MIRSLSEGRVASADTRVMTPDLLNLDSKNTDITRPCIKLLDLGFSLY